jgi:hypothetical protein
MWARLAGPHIRLFYVLTRCSKLLPAWGIFCRVSLLQATERAILISGFSDQSLIKANHSKGWTAKPLAYGPEKSAMVAGLAIAHMLQRLRNYCFKDGSDQRLEKTRS